MRRSALRLRALGALVPIFAACDERASAYDAARAVAVAEPVVPVPVAATSDEQADGGALIATLGCGACHAGLPRPAAAATPLTAGSGPRDPAALFAYLSDSLPARSASGARMPDFHLTEAEALALALYLGRGNASSSARRALQGARTRHADVDEADGARLFRAFACAACHGELGAADAPALANEGARVRPEWLRAFLRAPHAVRPFGTTPGSGARMPDFGLDEAEVESIATLLHESAAPLPPFTPDPPTPFAMAKTEALLERRFDCLGCHALDGAGGRIAPDLALASIRLQPAYIRALLDDPDRHAPNTIMPRPRLTAADRDMIATYLVNRQMNATRPPEYLSPLDHAMLTGGTRTDAERLYVRRCAACHGEAGRGDGFNARYLDVRPVAHAEASAMERRPDDTLYDGIASGGRILGRSARMPAFGGSLEPSEIAALVAHIRELCACEPPAWSADGER